MSISVEEAIRILETSNVVGIYGVDELFACIETVNSIFEFERA